MFDIAPYLHPNDPWVACDGIDFVRRIYAEKYAIAALLRPASIVEIGVRCGYTAAAMLAASGASRYVGFDNDSDLHGGWQGGCRWAEKMLREKFPQSAVEVRIQDTQALTALVVDPPDLLIIDGDHSVRGSLHDLALASKVCPRWILLDDVIFDSEVRQAARQFLNSMQFFASRHYTSVLLETVRGDLLLQVRKV